MAWNPTLVATVSATAGTGFLQPLPTRTNIRPPSLATAIRRLASSSNLDPESPNVLAAAHVAAAGLPPSTSRHPLPTIGFVAQWLSEVPGPSALDPLLRHADEFLKPSWHLGGLYYPRNDAGWDEEGNYIHMEPYSGNAAIGYGRLNVQGGQRTMYECPWRREEVRERVCVEGVDLGMGVDFVRGVWVEEGRALVVTLRRWEGVEVEMGRDGTSVEVGFVVKGLELGSWGVYVDGRLAGEKVVRMKGEDVKVEVQVGRQDVDVVVLGF